jgi:hypothetical protein
MNIVVIQYSVFINKKKIVFLFFFVCKEKQNKRENLLLNYNNKHKLLCYENPDSTFGKLEENSFYFVKTKVLLGFM